MAALDYFSPDATNPGLLKKLAAIQTSAGAGDAGKIIAADSGGKIDASLLPGSIGGRVETITTSETLAAGDLVNIHVSSGRKARKADASQSNASRAAQGFVLAGFSSAASATVYMPGEEITGLTGLTEGLEYFLSGTAGLITATPPATAGHLVQSIGFATDTTSIQFNPQIRYIA